MIYTPIRLNNNNTSILLNVNFIDEVITRDVNGILRGKLKNEGGHKTDKNKH